MNKIEGKRIKGRLKKMWIDNIANLTGISFAVSHDTQPAGVERDDEEVNHDSPRR